MDIWQALAKLYGWTTRETMGVADEAAAFLEGRLLGLVQASGGPVAPWLWLNAVAHGDLQRLDEIATAPMASGPRSDWSSARMALAQELLELAAGDPAIVEKLQHQILIPLEGRLSAVTGLTPESLFQIAANEMRLVVT